MIARPGLALLALMMSGCVTSPPTQPGDLCAVFEDKRGWYGDAADARDAWGSPIYVSMAIMHQESRFKADAKPPRKRILGFIPGPRPSNSYGYSQALKSTWRSYERSSGNYGADRDDFADSVDFVGWYNDQSHRRNGIAKTDTYRLYLAYHEGHGGFARGSFRHKDWLLQVARKVERRAQQYRQQLARCESDLQDEGGWFSWF